MTRAGVATLVKRVANGWPGGSFLDVAAMTEVWADVLEPFSDADGLQAFRRIIRDKERRPGVPTLDEVVRYSATVKRERQMVEWQLKVNAEGEAHRQRLSEIEEAKQRED